MAVEYDHEVLGKEYPIGTFKVDKETIIKFAQVVGETNPLFTDEEAAKKGRYGGLVAPPTFYSIFRVEAGPDLNIKFGRTSFNAGQRCEFYKPIRPGDTISVTAKFTEVFEKSGRSGRMVFSVRETIYTNQDSEKVAVVKQTMVRRE
ncbi:MAG: MaoC family dehydratase N-terminal domain-containing protein [Candidatus Tectomicrobia bacterium]|nr:MaoC family dehydratase N-terminal domain-containing protein [Candidatus Tectomicrobia bacterium]